MLYPKIFLITCISLLAFGAIAQDTIIFENKFPLLVEIVEESESRVIYKKYPPELGNLAHIMQKRFITEIRYLNEERAKEKFKSDATRLEKRLDVWVSRIDKEGLTSGLMHNINDSSLVLKKKSVLFSGVNKGNPEVVYIFPYQQINYIKVRKQNQIVQLALAGAAMGLTLGTVTGLAVFKDTPPCDPVLPEGCDPSLSTPNSQWSKAWKLGFASAGLGALTGGIIGGVRVKIPVGGKKDQFNAVIPKLDRLERALREK